MKKLLVLVVVVAVAWIGGRWAMERFGSGLSADGAERRVRVVLTGMEDGGDEQAAASMFLDGVTSIGEETRLTMAYDRWMTWRREKGMRQAISSFSVDDVDTSGEVPIVEVTIDGTAYRIAVAPKGQLSWDD